MTASRTRQFPDEEQFTFHASKDQKVFVYWRGTQAKVLKGEEAQKFILKMAGLDKRAAQLVMAKITGNFKRGNER